MEKEKPNSDNTRRIGFSLLHQSQVPILSHVKLKKTFSKRPPRRRHSSLCASKLLCLRGNLPFVHCSHRGTLDLFVKQCLRNSFLSASRFSNLKQMVGCHTKSCVTPKINTLVLKNLCNKILSIFAYQRVSGKLRSRKLRPQTLRKLNNFERFLKP